MQQIIKENTQMKKCIKQLFEVLKINNLLSQEQYEKSLINADYVTAIEEISQKLSQQSLKIQ